MALSLGTARRSKYSSVAVVRFRVTQETRGLPFLECEKSKNTALTCAYMWGRPSCWVGAGPRVSHGEQVLA